MEDGLVSDPFAEYGSLSQWAAFACEKKTHRTGGTTIEMPDVVAKQILSKALEDLLLADRIKHLQDARKSYVVRRATGTNKKRMISNPFPWSEFGLANGTEARALLPRLTAASYIVIAMLTGMRFHEIVAIKAGSENHWSEETVEANGVLRKFYFVISRTNKLQAIPTEYMWQALPIVKAALDAADRGLSHRRGEGKFLFPAHKNRENRLADSSLANMLNNFISFHDIRFEGQLWPLSTHQFRKKFARLMVRQGLGLKELQDQLKHFDIEMTTRYGDMNLYIELQKEKFAVSAEQYEELLANNVPVIGGGAGEIRLHQKQFLGSTKAQREVFLKQLPRSAVIEQLDDGLCMYRPEKALCGGDKAACRPADCNNSIIPAIGKRKTLQWRRQENHRLLIHFNADAVKVAFLTQRNEELDKLLRQLDEAEQEIFR